MGVLKLESTASRADKELCIVCVIFDFRREVTENFLIITQRVVVNFTDVSGQPIDPILWVQE
jgi:hypothetical protein